MRVIPIERVPEVEKVHPRAGLFRYRNICTGVEGSPNNFSLELVRTFGDFYSPRHRHNFDQFRFQLEGRFDFARDGKSVPGTVIYHPESAPYGPQTSSDESLVLVLQFGGASGGGYMSARQIEQGIRELEAVGEFDKGVFTRRDGEGRKSNQDATEAVWEHVSGRPIDYAPPRYEAPVFMHRDRYGWLPAPGEPGVSIKPMGAFTERRIEVGFARLDAGAWHRMTGPKLYFVVSGEGRVGDDAYRRFTTIHLEAGERGEILAAGATEVYFMGLPDFDEGAAGRPA